ncbi:MAG: hypothetical protein KF766_07715 [Rhodocyclaceae bacterium]|nr:hypothetical protein [Rhodocyclaceae bacterium]
MFIGHFGIGFGAEAAALRVSLGTLFLAAESPCCAGLGQVVLGHWLLVLRAFWVDSHRSSRTAAWRG